MKIRYQQQNKNLIFWFSGELDEYSANHLKDKMDTVIINSPATSVIFDLEDLSFADSTGIGLFIGRYKMLSKRNIPLYIRSPQPQMDKIMSATGLYDIMPKIKGENQ